jgi:hypothetical protein
MMNPHEFAAHTYPMIKFWQYINRFFGFWSWLCVIASIVGTLFLLLVFKWARKVFPAFRNMMAGGTQSYLRLSSDGLAYRNWPWFEIRCKWEDVRCIKSDPWLGDVLLLQRADPIGFPEFSIFLNPLQVHLSSLVGWAEGGLKDDLRYYAPQLFRK